MNKHRRHELKMLKYKKRLKLYGLKEGEEKANLTAFRSHGKPCSCYLCRNPKYRNTLRQKDKVFTIS